MSSPTGGGQPPGRGRRRNTRLALPLPADDAPYARPAIRPQPGYRRGPSKTPPPTMLPPLPTPDEDDEPITCHRPLEPREARVDWDWHPDRRTRL